MACPIHFKTNSAKKFFLDIRLLILMEGSREKWSRDLFCGLCVPWKVLIGYAYVLQ
jgi:hypothetical protein